MDEASDGIDCSVELKCFLGSCPLAVGLQNLVNVSIYRMGLLNPHVLALHSATDLSGLTMGASTSTFVWHYGTRVPADYW